MRSEQSPRRRMLATALGAILGLVAGVSAATWSTAVAAQTSNEPQAILDATHLPPLLTTGEPLNLLYDVHCAASDDETADEGCDVRGSVLVRSIGDPSYSELALASRTVGGLRQLAAVVPDTLTGEGRGIEYYAVVEAPEVGKRLLLPAGGPAAPHVSRPLGNAVTIDLGRHVFGRDRRADARVASAAWGERPGQAGLEEGRNLTPIGASSFDVDARGNVLLLDQVHRRLLRWSKGDTPEQVPVSVAGTLADMAVADDGSFYVLESTAPPGRNPLVKRFDDGGRELEAIESAERTPSQIRIDERGPVVLGRPSHHWVPLVVGGVPVSADKQLTRGRAGRQFGGGREVVVYRHADEVRVAVVAGQNVIRSWRVRSSTALAEVQLVEPWGQRIVLVVRVYEAGADEFVVLVLGRDGIVERFALASVDWAESAPLGRFRLVGKSLYRLGSSPSGVFIDRFDLEVR
jgi:hypothetical protein